MPRLTPVLNPKVFWFLLLQGACQLVAGQAIEPFQEATDSQEIFIGPDARVHLSSPVELKQANDLLVGRFQNHKGASLALELLSLGDALNPLIFQLPNDADAGPYWGYLAIKGKDKVGLRLGRFGPNIPGSDALSFKAGEKAVLEINIAQQLAYGDQIHFRLSVEDFNNQNTEHRKIDIYEPGTASLLLEEGKALLPLDFSYLPLGHVYFANLESQVGDIHFLPRRFQFNLVEQALTGEFKAIPNILTEQSRTVLNLQANQSIKGISASSPTASNPEFDPRKDIDIRLEGVSLWQLDTSKRSELKARSLASGDIKEVIIQRGDLPTGKHSFTLEFDALNAKGSAKTEVTFVVKKHAIWAFTALIAGVLLSFIVTKGLKLGFERGALRKRINKIKQQSWLKEDRWGATPIVRAFIRVVMADRALNYKPRLRWFNKVYLSRLVTAPQILVKEIENVEARMEVYSKLNRIAIRWGVAPSSNGSIKGMDYRIMWRASKEIRYLVYKLSQLHNDEKIPAEVLTKLDKLEAWSDPSVMLKEYEISQKRDIDKLLPQIDEKRFENASCKQYCTQLSSRLNKPQKVESIQDLLVIEENYILLKLLWEQRKWPDRCIKLVEKLEAQHALEVILEEFDQEIWRILNQPDALKIANPAGTSNAVEQYALTEFKVDCMCPEANTFLFKHGIQFEWHIHYGGDKALTPVTHCPSVTQFIPHVPEGTEVEVSVRIRWGDKVIALEGEEGSVRFKTYPTRRFKDLWPVNSSEVASVLLALVLALLAGFQSDAFSQALEGSWPELLVLLAWGVGADQMKNLIQNLNTLGR